jgi:hypothetical protein
VLDPLWNHISPSLHEHIDGLRSVWPKPAVRQSNPDRAAKAVTPEPVPIPVNTESVEVSVQRQAVAEGVGKTC